jgi:type II restriction/modification system DNA methylase subunit YeeA
MTVAEFKKKWSSYQGKETSAYQGHFDDLCRLLGQPTPAEADPSGHDYFCYQKRVVKDAELFDLEAKPDAGEPSERGFADVWKKGHFAWEYKGKKKNLDEAYKQLLRYRESLLNPPLLVVCDFDRYIIKTNFNGTVQEVYEFTNDQIDRSENLRTLRALFSDPEYLKPHRTTAQVTKYLAAQIAEIAKSLQSRESVEWADAKSRAELNVAQKKNLRIARFLNRIVFCFFAENTGLLPKKLFTEIAKTGIDDPKLFAETLEKLFAVMAAGGTFGKDKIRCFNGHLFEEATVFELTETELGQLAEASDADWQFIEPSIMGTLFERALEPEQRSQLGAHYTSEADIKTLVEPVLMQPFRRDWATINSELAAAYARGKGNAAQRERLATFQKRISAVTVLDPACGSGNFLYVSLQLLLGLEKEVITFATQLGFTLKPQVTVSQLKALEINPYAFELAQVSVQIGYLQWRRDNGFKNDRTPVLQVLDGFENTDALLRVTFRTAPKNLKEAREQEHVFDSPFQLKAYHERQWPDCNVIISNPPFLGDKLMRGELGHEYAVELRRIFSERIPGQSDLCCYWFEKARELIAGGKCHRAGLLATQGIRGGANREVLKRIKQSGNIFFAVSDHDWILDGANVHVSMVGFDNGGEVEKWLDGRKVDEINANLSTAADMTKSRKLPSNENLSFLGSCKGGDFDISEAEALNLVNSQGNPRQKLNSELVKPVKNSEDLLQRPADRWIIDTADLSLTASQLYKKPYNIIVARVKPHRDNNRDKWLRVNWWRPQRMRPEMRTRIQSLERFLVTTTTSKHRIFVWLQHPILPDHQLIVFARGDDYFMGVLQSRLHEVWALAQGTQLREKVSGFRYTPTTCFETFPFPFPDDLQPPTPPVVKTQPKPKESEPDRTYAENLAAKNYYMGKEESPPYGVSHRTPYNLQDDVAAAAKDLNELRENWLNPPEWTVEEILEFPGSADGPWSRFVVKPDKNGIGTVRYPRLEPRDADCAAKLKERTLTKLYNERPTWLGLAHKKLDAAVAAAYGWAADLSDEAVLEKLLALNLERAAAEAKAANLKKPKTSREKNGDEMI